ncbi:MAG: LamG domain-containing protein [Limnochordia bacterium]
MRVVSAVTLCVVLLLGSIGMAAPSKENAMLYFSFEEIVEDRVVEGTGKSGIGTISGKITLVEGVRGQAGQFAPNTYIDIGTLPADVIPKDEITISVWFNVPSGTTHEILNARASDGTWVFHPEIRSDGRYRWLVRTKGANTVFDMQTGSVAWSTWTHFAGVYSASQGYAALYINGQEIARQPVTGVQMMQDWGMGARVGLTIDDARPFSGKMDDLIVWNKALSADDIKYVMENGIGE